MLVGPIAGVLAAAVLAGSPTLIKESATLLTDVPAAALLLTASALLWWALEERPAPGRALTLAAAVAGLAFLMRYGSVVVLAPMAAVVVALWWRRLWTHRVASLGAVAVVGVLAVGHAAWSVIQTGAPLGILVDAQNVVSGDARDVPSRDYRGYLGFTLAGSIGATAMRLGVESLAAASFAAALWPRWRRELRAAFFLLLPAFAQIFLVTRGVGHAEPRFFIYSTGNTAPAPGDRSLAAGRGDRLCPGDGRTGRDRGCTRADRGHRALLPSLPGCRRDDRSRGGTGLRDRGRR
jgi:4-amino-4-deoxy-L-arabinose transferase-like glycosyltransferase